MIAGENEYFRLIHVQRQQQWGETHALYHLEHFGSADKGGQGRGERCRKDASRDEGAEPRHHAHDLEKRDSSQETHPMDNKNKQTDKQINKNSHIFI